MNDTADTRNIIRLARLLVFWLWVHIAMKVAFMATLIASVIAVYGPPNDAFPYRAVGLATSTVAMISIVLRLGVGVMVLTWIYRACRNALSLAPDLPLSPGWAVGWYFVPIAALWKPFAALALAWRGSVAPSAWRTESAPSIFGWWWAFWITSGVAGFLAGLVGRMRAEDTSTARYGLLMTSTVLGALAALLLMRIVRRLSDRQATTLGVAIFA